MPFIYQEQVLSVWNPAKALSAIIVRRGGDQASDLDAALAWDRVKADEIQGEVLQHRQIVRGVLGSRPHLILREGDIPAPMQTVLYPPMGTNRMCRTFCIRRQAGNVVTMFNAGLSF